MRVVDVAGRISLVSLVAVVAIGACKDRKTPPAHDPPHVTKPNATPVQAPRDAYRAPDDAHAPLAEVGPHPDYPTPVAAGTDKIFTLEEPARGPQAPLTYAVPPASALIWTTYAFCDDDAAGVTCGGHAPIGLRSWRVGRKGRELLVAESHRGAIVDATYIHVAKPDGTPIERVHLDGDGQVASAMYFTGTRYTERTRYGGNALDGCGYMAYALDAAHRIAQLACLQWTGEPMRDTDGVATQRFTRDARGFVTEIDKLGLDGKPIADTDGVTIQRQEHDAFGRLTISRDRDADGAPVAETDGCFAERSEYDKDGTFVRWTCLDAHDQPIAGVNGVAMYAYRTNDRGCRIGVRRLAADAAPIALPDGGHGDNLEVDDHCATKTRACIDIAEQPIACGPRQPAKWVYTLDAHGRTIAVSNYDRTGAPSKLSMYEVFQIRTERDPRGLAISESCFDVTGKPVVCGTTGFHKVAHAYDDVGREIESRYFDVAGAPTSNLDTFVRRNRYDNYDQSYESRSYDADGALIESLGSAIRRDLWDTAHRHFAVLLFDRDNQPAKYTGCYSGLDCPPGGGWHAVRIVRTAAGVVDSNEFFDAAGQLIATYACSEHRCFK